MRSALGRPTPTPERRPLVRRRKKTQGRTHVTIRKGRDRTLRHVDPTDPVHVDDHERFSAIYKAALEQARAQVRDKPDRTLKYPSLAGGFMLDATGRELTSEEHFALLKVEQERRGWYCQETQRADGTPRLRKCVTDPLHLLAVCFRPDYALALSFLSGHPKAKDSVKPFLKKALGMVAEEFQAATGLEPVAEECHPEEGNLHGHLTYASVSADNRLLWAREGKGRKGLRLLGPNHCGTIRLAEAGYLPESDSALARQDLAERMRSTGGDEPVDLRISRSLDALCERFFAGGLRKIFEWAAEHYRADLAARRAERPDVLKAAKEKAEAERDQLASEVAALKAEVARLAAAPPVFVRAVQKPVFDPAIMPPVPAISLTRNGPTGPHR